MTLGLNEEEGILCGVAIVKLCMKRNISSGVLQRGRALESCRIRPHQLYERNRGEALTSNTGTAVLYNSVYGLSEIAAVPSKDGQDVNA